MAYGRFRARRSYRRRGMRRTARTSRSAAYGVRRRRYNRGGIKIEINHKDMVFGSSVDTPIPSSLTSTGISFPTAVTGSAAMTHITEVKRGDSEEERVGGRFKCISLELKGNFLQHEIDVARDTDSGERNDPIDSHCHVALVEKKRTQGTQIVPSNVFDSTSTPLRVHDQVDDYRIIWHKEIKFTAIKNGLIYDGTNWRAPQELRDFHMYTKLWQTIDFTNVATGDIADCRGPSLHLFVWVEQAAGTIAGNTNAGIEVPKVTHSLRGRLRFIDC